MREEKTGIFSRIGRWTDRLRGRPLRTDMKPYRRILQRIDETARALGLGGADDAALRQRAAALQARAQNGASLDDLLPEMFALVREASFRTLGLRPFDEQVVAGIALHQGKLVEMQTGEGKTLAAVMPACLNALTGRGVHLLTFNDYLADRDAHWMGPVYRFMGLEVQCVTQGMDAATRRAAYRADVTYLTAKEAGYDFLRESIARRVDELILRPCHFAIVDEADSILIDEARVPLVIAGSDDSGAREDRARMAQISRDLEPGVHHQTDENRRNVFLTGAGIDAVEELLGCDDLHAPDNLGLLTRLNQALHAEVLLARDVDYIVRDERVTVVDEFTGRVVPDRHWPDGLHRALEAKEGLGQRDQGKILNSIAMQHFVGLYPKLAGMTGTARPADREFHAFYGIETVVIPTHRPCIRIDHEDVLFCDLESKHRAIVDEVQAARSRGQPVLIGTSSVQESEDLAQRMRAAGVGCQVLNAAHDAREAAIVAEAGAPGAVTVSTNMAGRGTDIRLGGADERSREAVVASGGLYVIGTNRHESRRIDDQLRGRAGRQGDPGESRFFISLEDPLMVTYGIGNLITPYRKSRLQPGVPIRSPGMHRKVAIVQRIIEGQNFDIRQTLWRYTSYVEEKRRQVHAGRSEALRTTDEIERLVRLHHTDDGWCDYLAHIADVREAIYLQVVGSRDPLSEFLKEAARSFLFMEDQVDADIADTLARIRNEEPSVARDKLKGPSSTWTYLINDNPFEWKLSLGSARRIGAGAWAGVLMALFWFIPLGYWLTRLFRRRPKRGA